MPKSSFFSVWTHARAIAKLAGLLAWSTLLVPLQLLVLWRLLGRADPYTITKLWHRGVCVLIGVRVQMKGTPLCASRTVYVSNHVSHFDIPVLGSVLKGSFVAKDDMARWPVAGFMARLQQTVFISRDPRAGRAVTNSIAGELRSGRSLILFPEGTTSDGSGVLPFKSSIFGILFAGGAAAVSPERRDAFAVSPERRDSFAVSPERRDSFAVSPERRDSFAVSPERRDSSAVSPERRDFEISASAVQPVTIRVLAVDGRAVRTQADRDAYAFYGDMHAGAHAWAFLRCQGARIEVRFADAITADPALDRKALAQRAHSDVLTGLLE